jgi:hypothetical protein
MEYTLRLFFCGIVLEEKLVVTGDSQALEGVHLCCSGQYFLVISFTEHFYRPTIFLSTIFHSCGEVDN